MARPGGGETLRIHFLGTGASGGTPGSGRSARRESSALVEHAETRVLLDAGRDLGRQLDAAGLDVGDLDAVALTHGHRDASGGVPELARRLRRSRTTPLPLLAEGRTLHVVRHRHARLDGLAPVEVAAGRATSAGRLLLAPARVPHARSARFPTVGWRVEGGGRALVYASDVARPTAALRGHAAGAALLVADGATFGQRIFSHLRIDEDLPTLCSWDVEAIRLTQIGRGVPPHEELEGIARGLCPRAAPAHDGLVLEV